MVLGISKIISLFRYQFSVVSNNGALHLPSVRVLHNRAVVNRLDIKVMRINGRRGHQHRAQWAGTIKSYIVLLVVSKFLSYLSTYPSKNSIGYS